MKRISDRNRGGDGGFTLIELLVVIVILAVLSAIVVFAVRGTGDRGSAAAFASDAKTVRSAEESFCATNGRYAAEQELVGKFLSEESTYNDVELGTYVAGASTGAHCGNVAGVSTYRLPCDPGSPGCGESGTTPQEMPLTPVGLRMAKGEHLGYMMTAAGADLSNPPDGVNDVWASVHSWEEDPDWQLGSYYSESQIQGLDGRALANGQVTTIYKIRGGWYPDVTGPFELPMTFDGNLSPQLTNLGDVTGDGKPDLLAAIQPGNLGYRGAAWIFDGATGNQVRELADPYPNDAPATNHSRFGFNHGSAGDVTGDGKPDAMVGAAWVNFPIGCSKDAGSTNPCTSQQQGQVVIYDSATGAEFRRLDMPDVPAGGCRLTVCSFGISAQSPGDVTGDNVPDQLVGAEFYNGRGRLYLFSGATGALVSRIDPPRSAPTDRFSRQFVPPNTPGDLNNDGKAEVYGGALEFDGPSGVNEGRAWVYDGASVAVGAPTVLYELADPSPLPHGKFGAVMVAVDRDGNGTKDFLYVGQHPTENASLQPPERTQGGTAIFDAANGRVVRAVEPPPEFPFQAGCGLAGGGIWMGWSLAAPGDLNGDGRGDLLAGAPYAEVSPCPANPTPADPDFPGIDDFATRDVGVVVRSLLPGATP